MAASILNKKKYTYQDYLKTPELCDVSSHEDALKEMKHLGLTEKEEFPKDNMADIH